MRATCCHTRLGPTRRKRDTGSKRTGSIRTEAPSENRHAGLSQVIVDLRHSDGLTIRPIRSLAGLEALSELAEGTVEISEAQIDLRGLSGNPEIRQRLTQILSDRLGEAQGFNLAVRYEEKLNPAYGLPTPEECVERLNPLLSLNKITFAPSSADIAGDGQATLDQMAELMKPCSDVPMEIGGHTDSQGRESMNLELSQARADAVLNGLMERRVLTSQIVSKGYGEAEPIADNGTEAGREANRRITFTLLPGAEETGEGAEGSGSAPEGESADE